MNKIICGGCHQYPKSMLKNIGKTEVIIKCEKNKTPFMKKKPVYRVKSLLSGSFKAKRYIVRKIGES